MRLLLQPIKPHAAVLTTLAALALPVTAAAQADIVIVNGRLADGSGGPLREVQVAVTGDRVTAIAENAGPARLTLDAGGGVIAPGFIDVHTHSENLPQLPLAENFLRMGVTTLITGNCGSSVTDVAAFFATLEHAGLGPNVATLIGHNSVRRQAMGGSFLRRPSPEQMEQMIRMVDQAMLDGAVGLSTGLIYNPGSFAKTDEIIALAKAAAAHDGIYVSHMRHETVKIFDAIDELLTIAREANIPAQVSHIKLTGPTAWGQAQAVLAKLDKARSEGLRLTHDQYAYTASSTSLGQLIPDSAREGGREAYRARIADPEQRAAIIGRMADMRARIGREDYSYAVIAANPLDPALNGLPLPQAAKQRLGADSLDQQIELILELESAGGASGVFHGMNEEDLQAFMAHPLTMAASDGGPRRLGENVPHPRSYGNNARILGRYVRELQHLSLPEAVRRMTSLPAETFQLAGRGMIRPGAIADVVVFDPDTVSDPATFDDPHHFATGFVHILVNGKPVIHSGDLTNERPGRPVRRAVEH